MSKLLNLIAITVVFIFILFSLSLAQEQITITTYYPSPYGSYQDLTVANSLRLETSPTAPVADGPQIEWRTGTPRHWNIDQSGDTLRFFTENNTNGALAERIYFTENANIHWFKAEEVTIDPLNGWVGYTTGTVPRYSRKCHLPCT